MRRCKTLEQRLRINPDPRFWATLTEDFFLDGDDHAINVDTGIDDVLMEVDDTLEGDFLPPGVDDTNESIEKKFVPPSRPASATQLSPPSRQQKEKLPSFTDVTPAKATADNYTAPTNGQKLDDKGCIYRLLTCDDCTFKHKEVMLLIGSEEYNERILGKDVLWETAYIASFAAFGQIRYGN
ncbi:hypothetical protein IV203_024963 [Nitzschia inconspicua]|uniref:Uncharacterized protein n=1 Tax=Nitzschia inconspicua TaxID=303405 RepID=A0A9K3P9Z8_9STRA|nr:hypothetical protein IV203_024963 [Nitzschia inconspicua]